MWPETATLSLGKVRAARGDVVVLRRKPCRGPQLRQNASTAAATNPTPALVPASALAAPIVGVWRGVLPHVVGRRVARQIDDKSLSPRKNG